MGNNTIELIKTNLEEIKKLISIGDYKNSYIIYKELYLKLIGVNNDKGINYLLSYISNPKDKLLFSMIIENLKNTDKIRYLFHLIYEKILVESIDMENDNNKDEKKNLNEREQEKEKIIKKIDKILKIKKYIKFTYFQSCIYELLAEKYFNLANMNYSDFIQENRNSLLEINNIIIQYTQCKDNYMNSNNYKKKMDIYINAYNKIIEHKKLLIAFQNYKEKNYNIALKCFNEINSNDPKMIEEKEYGINLCNEKLGEEEKENKNYEKALEYFTKSKNNFQIFQLKLLINEKKIINCIKEKKYENSLNFFIEIFKSYNDAKISYDEKKYSDILTIFIDLIIKLSLFYYEKKNIQKFKESIEDTINQIDNNETKIQIEELIIELNNIEMIEHKELYQKILIKLNSKNKSGIKQRFYISLLITNFLNEKTIDILKFLLKEDVNLNYISEEAFKILKNYLKNIKIDNIDELLLISKIFYKIIVSLNKFNQLDCLVVIGDKIKELNKIPDLINIYKLNDIMENLIYSFQEIMINNKNIKSYEGYKNLLLLIISKNNNFINCITNGLLFLSETKNIIEKKFIFKLKDYLIKNENNNLLQILLLQFQLNPSILLDNISIIYDILFFYQKLNNSNESQIKIFEFLLTLDIDIISSQKSILSLEKYSNEGNIEPKFFDLIEKIPLNSRGIYLSQKLLNYNENKCKFIKIDKINLKNQLSFKLYFQKDDLPLVEKNLDDTKILEKLIYSLKQQKYLYNELNIENITKNFSLSKKELFNLLIENKVHFNNNSLINLLQGFYKDNDIEIRETFNMFYKIKEYEKFSEIININLKIEEFLFSKEYLKMDNLNNLLYEIINNFSFLFGFSSQHENYILYILDLPSHANYKNIIDKMLELLLQKNFDIGIKIFKKIILTFSKDKFIELSEKILSNNNISFNIKNITLKYLYNIITSNKTTNEYKIKIFSSFKFFIDKIKIPDIILQYLISYLKNPENNNIIINKEIILFLGIYFSKNKSKQEKYLNEIIKIYENNEIYKYIINNIKSITIKNNIFYMFSNLYYYNFTMEEKDEEKILELPKKYLIDFIKKNFEYLISEDFEKNIIYMEDYFKLGTFSPKRDAILRNLFFNGDKNAVQNLRLICH